MKNVNWKEMIAVLAIGTVAAVVVVNAPVIRRTPWFLMGAGLYGLGYVAAQNRPAGGWPMLKG